MTRSIPIVAILAAVLAPLTILAVIVVAVLLDVFAHRPAVPASITTLLPGMVYATKTVILVSIGASIVAAVIALTRRERCEQIPWWPLSSIASVPFAPLVATITVLTQIFLERALGIPMGSIPRVAQSSVLAMLACITAGLIAGVVALVRRERPGAISVLGIATNVALLGVFRYFEFYKLGFDQDRWASTE